MLRFSEKKGKIGGNGIQQRDKLFSAWIFHQEIVVLTDRIKFVPAQNLCEPCLQELSFALVKIDATLFINQGAKVPEILIS